MSTDSQVQVQPDSTGAKIDASTIVRSDGTTAVQRQRVNISDAENRDAHAVVDAEPGRGQLHTTDKDLLDAVTELNTNFRRVIELLTAIISD